MLLIAIELIFTIMNDHNNDLRKQTFDFGTNFAQCFSKNIQTAEWRVWNDNDAVRLLCVPLCSPQCLSSSFFSVRFFSIRSLCRLQCPLHCCFCQLADCYCCYDNFSSTMPCRICPPEPSPFWSQTRGNSPARKNIPYYNGRSMLPDQGPLFGIRSEQR